MKAREDGLEDWAKGQFGVGGKFTGELYGNTDWALARKVWSAALEYSAKVEADWQLAPIEPTQEMNDAFHRAITVWLDEIGEDADVYKAMLKAAPKLYQEFT